MHDNLCEYVERRVSRLHPQHEHLLRLQEYGVDLTQRFMLPVLMTVIANGPYHRQTQVLLVHVLQTALHLVDNVYRLHDVSADLIQIRLYDCLQGFYVLCLLYDL